jgi:hypothetical protein
MHFGWRFGCDAYFQYDFRTCNVHRGDVSTNCVISLPADPKEWLGGSWNRSGTGGTGALRDTSAAAELEGHAGNAGAYDGIGWPGKLR